MIQTSNISSAKDRLLCFGKQRAKLIYEDFLQSVDISNTCNMLSLFDEPSISTVNNSFDIVIANPP